MLPTYLAYFIGSDPGAMSLDSTVVVAPDGEVLRRADSRPMKADALEAFLDTALS
ncbi:hypothetical protein [Arthrobacter sp. VKM Ac-2550]|uniref:hypothetical protein n=1 Tax=Crystallibacter permensis TaxID=1938888 RepID=UPI002227FE1A|nr:hypothetical protein [Arthrobacter sp. VKM Ac-2550]MCW2131696.1 hypothetical protein [Arthrobacter sp. VKM Ac-2550]